MKSLQAPSTKDFLRIFAFLHGFLSPSYVLPDTKFEEEVPRIFKDLGYVIFFISLEILSEYRKETHVISS